MFFIFSKILWMIVAPLNLVFLVLSMGIIVSCFSKLAGRSLIFLALFFFAVFGILPTGKNMLGYLENQYQRPVVMPEAVTGILVMGGAFMTDISEDRGVMAVNDSAERVMEALILAKKYPQARLVFSGGNGHLRRGQRTEAQDTEQFLDSIGFDHPYILYEDRSRNSYENILFSKELVMPEQQDIWLLVTSAFHMPRALAVAQSLGWDNIQPYPVDYRTDGIWHGLPQKFDILGSMTDSHVALHEYIGMLAYRITGKISLPLQ